MASRRSVRIKSTSVLKKLKKKIGNKPKNSVGVKDVNLKRAATNRQINTARGYGRTRHSSTTESKQKENKISEILPRKTRNTVHQEDSRVKSCTVLAVKLKYPYAGRTASVKLNSRNTRTSDSPKALPRTAAKPSETKLDVQHSTRKSSRARKPTSKELKPVVVSTDNKSGLKKHSGEVSPQKLRNKSIKPQISNEISSPEHKVKDDMECVSCGITPSQFFGRDSKHNTVCCFCSLVKPPQELKALLQLLKLDCCLKFFNQKNQNAMETSSSPPRKRQINEHPSQAHHKSGTSGKNSAVRSLRERNSVGAQKGQNNKSSPKEQKKNTGLATRSVTQQKGNASLNLNKRSNSVKSPDLAAVSSTRSTRLMQRTVSPMKPSTKASRQTPSSTKNVRVNLKRKISPQNTQTPPKRRKLAKNDEVEKKMARAHTCGSCNSTFAMQWKLKLHELTHADKSYPNVILQQAEVENTSDLTNQNVEGERSEPMDCDSSSENAGHKNNLNVQVSKSSAHGKTTLDNENYKTDGDKLKDSEASKRGNKVKSTPEDEETANKDDSSDTHNTEVSDTPVDRENTEVNQETDKLDSRNVTTNSDIPSDKENIEVNEEPHVPTKCDENPTLSDHIDQSNKPKEDVISKKSDVSSNFEDKNSPDTMEDEKEKEHDKINAPSEPKNNRIEEAKIEQTAEKSKALDTASAEDAALDQSEVQNTSDKTTENNEQSEESGADVKANENDDTEEENESSNEICGNTAGENAEMHKDDEVESSGSNQNYSKGSDSINNSSDHCEQEDSNIVTEKESNSENTREECRSEAEETETEANHADHDNQHKEVVSESNEIKVNGIVTNDDNGSKSANDPKDTADNSSSQHQANENMTELYNQMNTMFEADPVGENKVTKTETEKKSPDHQLENGDNTSVFNDQK